MELRSVTAGGEAADAFAHRSALCLVRLTRARLTACVFGGLTVSDPSDWAVPCLTLHVAARGALRAAARSERSFRVAPVRVIQHFTGGALAS